MTEQQATENIDKIIIIPQWFKVVAIIALIWNLLGVLAFAGQIFITPEMLSALPIAEQELYANTPIWATVAFAVAVFSGAFGSLFLLMRKSLSTSLLIFSLVGIVVQNIHSFFMSKSFEVYGPGGMIMPVMVILIATYLVWLAKKAQAQGWFS
jgi:hypothetical protein